MTFTDAKGYFISEASVYRLLKANDLITSPAFVVIKAADEFHDKTTAPNQLWHSPTSRGRLFGSRALAASIFLSNLPEAAGGAKRMREMGWRDSRVLGLWFGAALLLTAAAVAGNLLFRHAPEEDLALNQAFAGGAVIASLATEIFPKAYRRDHHMAGVTTALGFLAALSLIDGMAGL